MAAVFQSKRQLFSSIKTKKAFTDLIESSESRPTSPTPFSPASVRRNYKPFPTLAGTKSAGSSARRSHSPGSKRFQLIRKQAQSESSLLDWVLSPSNCCRGHGQRPSEPDIKRDRHSGQHVSVDCFTLTPLYMDEERESFEVRRSAPTAVSPLPWATTQEPDYPSWLRNELRSSLKAAKRPSLSKAKSEERTRCYTIPSLKVPTTTQLPAGTAGGGLATGSVVASGFDSADGQQLPPQPTSPPITLTGCKGFSPKPEIRAIRRNLTADIASLPETYELVESPGFGPDSAPSFAVLQHRRSALLPFQGFGDSRRQSSLSSTGSKSGDQLQSSERLNSLSAQVSPRRRSSVVVIPPMQICPGDLLVYSSSPSVTSINSNKPPKSSYSNSFERHGPALSHSPKESPDQAGSTTSLPLSESGSVPAGEKGSRKAWSIMKLFDRSSRSKSEMGNLEDQLLTLKTSEFDDNALMRYKILHWSDLTPASDDLSESEIKRREAIWEMFQSELVLLLDHLLVLKHVFLEPLKQLQVEGFVMHVEPDKLFGNLDELCAANYELCANFADMMEEAAKESESQFVSIDRIVDLLRKTSVQEFEADDESALTFQRYCLNYINALNYLENLRKHDDFNEYEKFCSQDRRCHRLQLTDLLVTPVQHTMKRPLLLREICKHSEKCGYSCAGLKVLLEETESSLRGLDEKINWLRNFEKLQAIQKQLIWPSVIDLQDPKIFIPDVLKQHLAKQPCEGLILSPRRIILQEGTLSMIENGKFVEMQVFLFDDMLLLTRKRKGLFKKQKSSISEPSSLMSTWNNESSTRYVVYKQPMPLDRIMVHDMSPSEQGGASMKNSMVILHISRYQQIIGAVTLQAPTEAAKVMWLSKLRLAMDRWRSVHFDHKDSVEQTRTHISSVSEF